jgi:hypothetical protein
MSDEKTRREQVDSLLAQDHDIEAAKLKEFRMQLETSLADFERRGARVRKTAIIAGAVYLLNIVFALTVLNGAKAGSWRGMLMLPWSVVGWVTMIVGGCAIFLYFTRYMPAMRRLRYDIQNSLILDLQQQIAELREELKANRK